MQLREQTEEAFARLASNLRPDNELDRKVFYKLSASKDVIEYLRNIANSLYSLTISLTTTKGMVSLEAVVHLHSTRAIHSDTAPRWPI